MEDKVKSVGASFIETLNPLQTGATTDDKYIKITAIFLLIGFLHEIWGDFGMLRFMVADRSARWDISMILYFLPMVVLPVAGLLFWLRKKYGWVLVTIYLSYSTIGVISLFFMAVRYKPSGIATLDSLYTLAPVAVYFVVTLLLGAMIYMLCRKNIREIYAVNNQVMYTAIAVGAVPALLFLMAMELKLLR